MRALDFEGIRELGRLLSPERVLTRHIDRIAYAHDASYFHLVPQAVVQPRNSDEIRALFRFSMQRDIPLTFRAGGTSLSGQAVTNGILVDITKAWRRIEVEDQGRTVRVEPGLVGAYVNGVLKRFGRRLGPDPASMEACMIGGILANNSSGMCCGVTENSYRTVRSMKVVFPDGFMLDTGAPRAAEQLASEAPAIERGLKELKARLLEDASLAERVCRRYQMKNTTGYSLNAFLDFHSPLDILLHLMIGSEGTLGFIAEAVLETLPDYPHHYTGQLYFRTVQDAARAIQPLRSSGARAAEIMDRAALHSVERLPGAPDLVAQLPETAAAILVEYQGTGVDDIVAFKRAAESVCRQLALLHDPEFTEDPAAQARLWKLRKGLVPAVGAVRLPGTTVLIEDVALPVPRLAEGITDLQSILRAHGRDDAVIFGHAKDGNLHFVMSQSFNTTEDVARFDSFMKDLVRVVSGKYDGALKAEHGTGRNMAPFVETEWGANARGIMRDLKSLMDPGGILSPGVIINDDPCAHLTGVKALPSIEAEVDKCIECGYCEPQCPSRRLTLTPRQRIVVRREIARLGSGHPSSPELGALVEDYNYAALETCATDGLCALSCPVGINTGDLVKRLRSEKVGPKGVKVSRWLAAHYGVAERGIRTAVRLGHLAERLMGIKAINGLIQGGERLAGGRLPKWKSAVQHVPRGMPVTGRERANYVYFPSCISRSMGVPSPGSLSLAETMVTLARRAGVEIWIPKDIGGKCCGMPFGSTGYSAAFRDMLHKTLSHMWEWTREGSLPVVIDMTSCAYTLRTCSDALSPEDQARLQKLQLLDSLEFAHDVLLPRLNVKVRSEDVVLHPNCSARKLGLQDRMAAIGRRCARNVTVPLNLDCCGFAGNRGLTHPELTASATLLEAAEVNAVAHDGYYSSNIPCETGMSDATGHRYMSILYLLERATR